jgi:hypothetical protein
MPPSKVIYSFSVEYTEKGQLHIPWIIWQFIYNSISVSVSVAMLQQTGVLDGIFDSLLKMLYNVYPVMLIIEIHVTVKWRKVSDHQTVDASWLQQVFVAASVHFKSGSSGPRGTASKTPLRWHPPSSELPQVLPRNIRWSWKGLGKPAHSGVPTHKKIHRS